MEALFCPNCGLERTPESQFCSECGVRFRTEIAAPSVSSSPLVAEVVSSASGNAGRNFAGFWIRFVAWIIDMVIVVFIQKLVLFAVIFGPLSVLVGMSMPFVYFIILTAAYGRTAGKMVTGIEVIEIDGAIPSVGRVIVRETLGKFVSIAPLMLGYLWIGFSSEKRGRHDSIASTYVVRT